VTPDLVIRNGTVLDGTGADPFPADVAIAGGRIEACGAVGPTDARELDAAGCYVAPGFIDIHSHSDFTLLVDPRAVSALHQGVTLEVVGNCGHGCFPIADAALASDAIYGYSRAVPLTWKTAGEYFQRLEAARPAVNLIALVPNGQLRLAALGATDRAATPEELGRMLALLEESLEAGAWGLSTGLEYAHESATTEAEIVRLCRTVADAGGLYSTHTRKRDEGAPMAVAEAIRTARESGVRLQVSHLLPRGGEAEGDRCVDLLDAAAGDGLDVGFDMHTRTFAMTHLHASLPAWALANRAEALADPAARARMRSHRSIISAGGWSRVVLLANRVWPQYAGLDISTIARERAQDPFDAVCDLLLGAADEPHELIVEIPCYTEAQQERVFSHPLCAPGSDATTLAPTGPLAGATFPGAYSWAAWFYAFMVRERGLLSPAEAVRRLTGLPAERLGLTDRGQIREGARADVVVFDPKRYAERATTREPNRLADGVVHVLVNGVASLIDGRLTSERAGSVIRLAG
jgi:N-acyl-D-aspartate/D-glutamate deacylase